MAECSLFARTAQRLDAEYDGGNSDEGDDSDEGEDSPMPPANSRWRACARESANALTSMANTALVARLNFPVAATQKRS